MDRRDLSIGNHEIHYAWVIAVIAGAIGFLTHSVRFAVGAMVPYLRDSSSGFGWSYGAISFAFSLQWFVSGIVSPFVGWLGDKYGARPILFIGTLIFVAGMLLTGIMEELWHFYLFFGVMLGIATTIFAILPVASVTLWFRKSLGVAIGVVWSLQGVGSIVFILLVGGAFDLLGMRLIFWLPGIVAGVLILLLIRLFYNSPAEAGLLPYGAPKNEQIQKLKRDEISKIRARVFLQQAQRTFTFWNLIGIHYWGCMGHNIINVLLVAFAVDRGLSPAVAAGVLAFQQAIGVIARGMAPLLAERLGCKIVWVAGMALQTFPVLIVLFAHDAWAFYLFAFLFAIGQGTEVPTFPIANRQYYGNVPQGSLYGWQNIGNGLGMGMAPVLAGVLWDVTGNYAVPLIMSFGFSLIATVSALLLPSPRSYQIPDWEEALPPEARVKQEIETYPSPALE